MSTRRTSTRPAMGSIKAPAVKTRVSDRPGDTPKCPHPGPSSSPSSSPPIDPTEHLTPPLSVSSGEGKETEQDSWETGWSESVPGDTIPLTGQKVPPGWALLPPDDLRHFNRRNDGTRYWASAHCQFFGLLDPIPILIRPLEKQDIKLYRLIKSRNMHCIHDLHDGIYIIRRPTKIEDIIDALTTHDRLTGLDIFRPEHELKDRWGKRIPVKLCRTCERWNFDYEYTPDPCPDCTKLREVTEEDQDWGAWGDMNLDMICTSDEDSDWNGDSGCDD